MKRVLLSMVACMMALVMQAQRVEVRYFHGKQRCITCRSIEKYAKEVLDEEGNLKRKADMFTKRTIRPHEAVTSSTGRP